MAYKLVFRYTKQGNYAGPRIVNWSKFVRSGDTGKTVGQIESITYTHYHTSTNQRTWPLRGRITLADGTTFVSETDSHHISGNIVLYTNTFTKASGLPSPEQLNQISTIETINENDRNNNDGFGSTKLYWRALSDYPMIVTVTFVETPPTYYAPRIESFIVGRCDETGAENPEGLYVMTTLKLGVGNRAGLTDNMSLRVYYAENGVPTLNSPYIDLTSRAATLLDNPAYKSTQIITGTWAAGSSWEFMAVFSMGTEAPAARSDSIGRAYAPMFISADGKHLSFNGFPSRTTGDPSVEFCGDVLFHNGFFGADALAALGVQAGQTAAQSVPSGNVKDFTIAFPKPYAAAPVVIPALIGSLSGSSSGSLSALVKSVTTAGCTIRVASATSTYSVAVAWVAVGKMA